MPVLQGNTIFSSDAPDSPTSSAATPTRQLSPTADAIPRQRIPPLNAYLLGSVGLSPGNPTLHSPFHTPARSAQTQELAASIPEVPELPPLSSDGIIPTSPLVGSKEERKASARSKGARKRARTMIAKNVTAVEAAEERKVAIFDEILEKLSSNGLSFGQLMLYVFDPVYKQGSARWDGFFKTRGLATKILNFPTAQQEVGAWAEDYIAAEMRKEARQITLSKVLQTTGTPVNYASVTAFSMLGMGAYLQHAARVSMKVFSAFATSTRTLRDNLAARSKKRFTASIPYFIIITSAVLELLGEYSHKNNYSRRIMGLYLYATGAQRQTISVMSHLGISESYQNADELAKKIQGLMYTKYGSLGELSMSMRSFARVVASTGLYAATYDNINMMFRAAEQVMGRTDSQENGTCATIFPLWKAAIENMKIADLNAAFDKAPPLTLQDILLTHPELELMDKCLRHCILRIIVEHGGEKFSKFRDALNESLPVTPEKIELHKTPLHPLPAWNIDESTIVGNAEVADAIYEELEVKGLSHWKWVVKILAGDQLSIARLRSLLNIRAGNEGGFSGFGWGVWMPGLFHGKIADMHGFFVTHWGVPNRGTRNPGSLAFHNTHLHRSPILLSSLPPFRVCRDLAFVSLYSRILHCLLLVSGTSTLDQCADSINSFAQLEAYAASIQSKYANADLVSDFRWQRAMARGAEGLPPGDEIYENACLFIRDALISKEFSDSIKAGDSGRIVLVVKLLALSFRGNGRSKYAYEMLHLIHNLTHVWPKPIRAIILNNWLVNPTGNPFSWVEVDLMQEHMNFWIKTIYQAHGSAASWDWLAMVAPCITALRHLSTSIINILGSDQGTKHEPADLSTDIELLMKSLVDNSVYQIKGRVFAEGDGTQTPDVLTVGIQQLSDSSSNPLTEYNAAFLKLQARRRLVPLPQTTAAFTGMPSALARDSPPLSAVLAGPSPDLADIADSVHGDESDRDDLDSDDSSLYYEDESGLTAFEQVMDETDEPTLTRDTAADVALDMDGGDDGFVFGGDVDDSMDSDSDSDADPFVDDVNDFDYSDTE
ncbi:hypothetical protein FB451DRAFT_1344455 [Mycena latifolia]|nr:hypothetical protein FB451DRAFT_1344455 [Mycena latifolia]